MTTMDMRPGWDVFTSDGDRLGTIKEFTPDRLKIDAPMRPDFWVPMSTVAFSGSSRVELAFPKDEVDDYRLND
jgi:hypothetical protein